MAITTLSRDNIIYLFGLIARDCGIVDSTRSRCYIDNEVQLRDLEFESKNMNYSETPYNPYYSSVVLYNDEIHLLGGQGDTDGHYIITEYGYEQLDNLPITFSNHTCAHAVVYDNKIHILGTNTSSSYYTKHYSWDGYAWSEESTLPYNFYDACALVYDGKIHILGTASSNALSVNHYSWDGNEWVQETNIPFIYHRGACVIYNNEIHLIGTGATSTHTEHYSWDGSDWNQELAIPIGFDYAPAIVLNDGILTIGTYAASANYKKKYKFNGTEWINSDLLYEIKE